MAAHNRKSLTLVWKQMVTRVSEYLYVLTCPSCHYKTPDVPRDSNKQQFIDKRTLPFHLFMT